MTTDNDGKINTDVTGNSAGTVTVKAIIDGQTTGEKSDYVDVA